MSTLLLIVRIVICGGSAYLGLRFLLRDDPLVFYGNTVYSDEFAGWIFIAIAVLLLISIIKTIASKNSMKTRIGGGKF